MMNRVLEFLTVIAIALVIAILIPFVLLFWESILRSLE